MDHNNNIINSTSRTLRFHPVLCLGLFQYFAQGVHGVRRILQAAGFAALLLLVLGVHAQTVSNTGTVAPPAGLTDPTPANNSATDTDSILPQITLQKALGGTGRIAAADQFSLFATGTGAPAATITTGAGTAVTSAAYSFTATAGSAYVLNETMAAGSVSSLTLYSQTVACTNTGPTNVAALTTLPVNVTPAFGDAIICTITNTPKTATLQLSKSWSANSIAGNVANIGATTGGSANTVAFTSTASTAASSAAVSVTAGNTITLPAETMSVGLLANYSTALSCTANGGATANALSGINGQVSNTLVIGAGDAGKAIVCTYTNTRKSTLFRLAKAWGPGSVAGNVASIGATTGLTNNTALFTSTASTATNGANVTVFAGETATLPVETMSPGTLTNYNTGVSCNAGTLSGNNGQSAGNTVAITAADVTTNPIICTYTNTLKTTTLQLSKVWSANSIAGNVANIGATTGGSANTAAFTSTASTAAREVRPVAVTLTASFTIALDQVLRSVRLASLRVLV